MEIMDRIKKRIYRFFHPPLEDSVRKFTTNGSWAYEELDKWSRRVDKLCHPFRKDGEE